MSETKIEASFDGTHEDQGGPSGIVYTDDYAENLAAEMMWGINGVGSGPLHAQSSANDRDRLPAWFAPAPASNGQFLMGTSLEFVQKASKTTGFNQRLNYLVAIQDVEYDYRLKSGMLFGGLGPYIGYGLGGSAGSGSNKVAAFGSDGYKRFDAGLHFKAGYQFPSTLHFALGYELGLYDKSTDPSDWTSFNRTWSIAVGYSLNKIISSFKR